MAQQPPAPIGHLLQRPRDAAGARIFSPIVVPPTPASDSPDATPTFLPAPAPAPTASNASLMDMLNSWVEPNPLNQYWQTTYHFRLFMVGDGDVVLSANNMAGVLNNLNTMNQCTIVESGVTGYNIKDVEFETVTAQNGATLDQKATTWTMTVTEPLGVSFLDALYYGAQTLGIFDYTKMVYYLELKFLGYNDPSGSFAGSPLGGVPTNTVANAGAGTNGTPISNAPNGGTWVWALTLTTIDTKLSEGGAVYTMNFVTVDSASVMCEMNAFTSQTNLTISGNTVQDMLSDYASQLTDFYNNRFGNDRGTVTNPLATFTIKATQPVAVGPYKGKIPGNFSTTQKDATINPQRQLAMDNVKGAPTAHLTSGTSINDVILAVISSTDDGQALMKDVTISGHIDQSPNQPTNNNIREATMFSIEPDISIVEFDKTSGNYKKNIIINVVPFYTQSTMMSAVQRDAATPTVQRDMVMNMGTNGLIRRRYDYIFTGENTEVLDFDMHFNLAWQAIVPRFGGSYLNYDAVAVHAALAKSGETGTPANQPLGTPPNSNLQPTSIASSSAVPAVITQPAIPASTTVPAQTQSTAMPIGHLLQRPRDAAGARIFSPIVVPSTPASDSPDATPTFLPAPAPAPAPTASVPAPATTGTRYYIEDILTKTNQGQIPSAAVWPISLQTHYADVLNNSRNGMPGQKNFDRNIAATVLTQLYGCGFTAEFLSIDMTIRGDPFWIGQTNLERQAILRSGNPAYNPTGFPDWSTNRPVIFIYFRYPKQLGDDFKPILTPSTVFNGFYEVWGVKHSFNEGVYKQTLHANILPLIIPTQAFAPNSNDTSNSTAGSSPLATAPTNGPATGITPTPST